MPEALSPLRYPGGKGQLGPYLAKLVTLNAIHDGHYFEPYAGGAGAAWHLLLRGYVRQVHINDASHAIAAFWRSSLSNSDEFLALLSEVNLTIEEYKKQKTILAHKQDYSDLELGFSVFFVNRVNHSGILNAGPIGGYAQKGSYKMDARFNKKELQKRIETLALFASQIHVYQKDALQFISEDIVQRHNPEQCLIYCDPPYFEKGRRLYLDYYKNEDHQRLAWRLKKIRRFRWLLSYDSCPEIRDMYSNSDCQIRDLDISHSAHTRKRGQEILITPPQTIIPNINGLKVA